MQFKRDIVGLAVDYKTKVSNNKKRQDKRNPKRQDYSDFDKLIEELGDKDQNNGKVVKDTLKSGILGNDVMTDSQHRFIIALFTNELNWRAQRAFNFVLKVIPQIRSRLKARVIRESDIQALYRELNKTEASKLINIIKSIARRDKK